MDYRMNKKGTLKVKSGKSIGNDLIIKKLDINDSEQVEKYEKALFHSYYDPLIITDIEDRIIDTKNKRMKPKIPYKHLEIYFGEIEGKIINGIVLHFDLKSQWEIEMYGYEEFEKTPFTCEGFCMFNNKTFHNGKLVGLQLHKFIMNLFFKKRIRKAYGTCFAKKLKGYMTLGWVEKEKKTIGNDDLYLVELSI